jgi:prepilin-type N-terminal cleavage/methylation domain-containing protein
VCRRARRGVTLLELLVVLLLMSLSAVLVLPSMSQLSFSRDDDPRAAVIASSRRAAIRRGETLRLRIAVDGVWALVAQHDGAVVDGGRIRTPQRRGPQGNGETDTTEPGLVLTITAMGSCLPAQGELSGSEASAHFDVLACGWTSENASRSAGVPSDGR